MAIDSYLASILLRGGVVLTHGTEDQVTPLEADILIKDGVIAEITPYIQVSTDTKIFDCKDKILSPGFIDTHHHVWQSLLKGRHANELLLDYMYSGNLQSSNHTPADIYWGQLAGCLECLDAGTTAVVDHAHMNYSPEHSQAALAATVSSGIRSVFGYCPTPRIDTWKPFAMSTNMLPDWVMNTLVELASKAPFGNGRVQLGIAFDGWFLPQGKVVDFVNKVRSLGIKLITTHSGQGPVFGSNSTPLKLERYGILDSSILLSHCSAVTHEEAEAIKKYKVPISSTPSTELQTAMGHPIAFSGPLELQSLCSLGVDCHSMTSSSIPSEMRLLLQTSRALYNQQFLDARKAPKKVNKTVEEAFNMGTIAGARALRMEDQIGSLAVGKRADIVVFDALSPSMAVAAQYDPVAAIVLHSSPRDVVMTIVNGIVRKEQGTLSTVCVKEEEERWIGKKESLEWADVVKELVVRREVVAKKIDVLDLEEAREGIMKTFHISPDVIVDSI